MTIPLVIMSILAIAVMFAAVALGDPKERW